MRHYDPGPDGRKVDDNEANAIADLSEDFPEEAPPAKDLPRLTKLPAEEQKAGKDGIDRAMDMLDEYMEGVPPRNPDVPHDEE